MCVGFFPNTNQFSNTLDTKWVSQNLMDTNYPELVQTLQVKGLVALIPDTSHKSQYLAQRWHISGTQIMTKPTTKKNKSCFKFEAYNSERNLQEFIYSDGKTGQERLSDLVKPWSPESQFSSHKIMIPINSCLLI